MIMVIIYIRVLVRKQLRYHRERVGFGDFSHIRLLPLRAANVANVRPGRQVVRCRSQIHLLRGAWCAERVRF